MIAVPITIGDAKIFIGRVHRHRDPPGSALFAIAAAEHEGGEIVAVVTIGRPVAHVLQDGWTAEVTRLASIGTRNACSFLYAAAWRAARAMGYRRLVTYTLETEPGTSLRAAGFKDVAKVRAKSWSHPSRPRVDRYPKQAKIRWEVV